MVGQLRNHYEVFHMYEKENCTEGFPFIFFIKKNSENEEFIHKVIGIFFWNSLVYLQTTGR
jgi:hypothetical protein